MSVNSVKLNNSDKIQYAPPFKNSYQNKAFIHLQVKK